MNRTRRRSGNYDTLDPKMEVLLIEMDRLEKEGGRVTDD